MLLLPVSVGAKRTGRKGISRIFLIPFAVTLLRFFALGAERERPEKKHVGFEGFAQVVSWRPTGPQLDSCALQYLDGALEQGPDLRSGARHRAVEYVADAELF